MKRILIVLALLAVLLSACAPKRPRETAPTLQTEPVQTESTAAKEVPFWESPDHAAFQKALLQLHDQLYWPELPDSGRIEISEPATIEDEHFAIFDVDGDGEDELLVSIYNTHTVGMCEIIYGYDAGTGGVRIETQNYIAVTHYPGMLRVDASHSHGYAGDVMWPYQVLTYDAAEDTYKEVCFVDAWKKEITDYDSYRDMPYPEEIDTEHDGFVYLITENDELRILNHADFTLWEQALFSGKEPLTIPWQTITPENMGLERRDHPAAPSGELLHQADFSLYAGKKATVQLFGKMTSGSFYGVSDVVVRLEDGTAVPFPLGDGLARHWQQSGISHTEAPEPDGGLILEDVNFDGYTDIGLQVQVGPYNMPHVYWYYDLGSASYRVLDSFLCPLTLDQKNEWCIEEYRNGQVYYREIYKPQGRLLQLEQRWITEFIDGQPITRKDDHVGEAVGPAVIDGYALTPEGDSVPVRVIIEVEQAVQGEDAYRELLNQNPQCPSPEDGQEYIIVTVNVTYDGGELETLDFSENYPASWAAARVHFHIPNENGNSVNVTSYLQNPIWGHTLAKGESVSGDIAFLVEAGNTQPLFFEGYNQVVGFRIHGESGLAQ